MQREGSAHIGQSASRVRHRATPQHQMAARMPRAAQHRHRLGGNRRGRARSRSERFDRQSTASTESRSVAVPHPRPRPRRLLCRRLRPGTRCLASPGGWQATSEDGGSSWKLSLDPRLIGLTPDDLACRRHGAAWRSRPRLSRQPCPQTSLRKQQSSPLHPMSCSSAPTGEFLASRRAPGRLWLGGLSCPTWRFATRAPSA